MTDDIRAPMGHPQTVNPPNTAELARSATDETIDVSYQAVIAWLASLGLSRYARNFIENEISWAALPCLTEVDLIDIGIFLWVREILSHPLMIGVDKIGPRRAILSACSQLQKIDTHASRLFSSGTLALTYLMSHSRPRMVGPGGPFWAIARSEIDLQEQIGSGAFSIVYRARWRGQVCAKTAPFIFFIVVYRTPVLFPLDFSMRCFCTLALPLFCFDSVA